MQLRYISSWSENYYLSIKGLEDSVYSIFDYNDIQNNNFIQIELNYLLNIKTKLIIKPYDNYHSSTETNNQYYFAIQYF